MDNKLTEYILKHSKKRDKELKYDFMPSLLEIIERPAHKAGTVIIVGIFTLLVAAVVWACCSKIDVVITASGSMTPKGDLNVVKTYSAGIVDEICVTEGQYVSEGDVLMKLNTDSVEIDVNQLNSQKKILTAQQDIYTKIQNGDDVSTIKIDDYEADIKPYIQAILDTDTSYKNTLNGLEKDKTNADLNIQIAQVQLEQYQESGTQRQIQSQELIIQQYELALEKAELQITDTKTQYSAQMNAKLSEIEGQLTEISSNLEKYALSVEYQQITAPVSGYVNTVNVNTLGETVTSAQELVTIVPKDMPLEMVCYVKNMDICDIELGMATEIKLEAYPYNKYGTVKGEVKYISPSAFVSEQMGSVYLVKIEITDKNDDIDIISGLSGAVEIKTDKRTVMDYFLEPILKGFGESLREK